MWWRRKRGKPGDEADVLNALALIRERLERLEHQTVGIAAHQEEAADFRQGSQDQLQAGITGLREESREAGRRQDRMISDLRGFREELRDLLDLAPVLREMAAHRLADAERPADTERSAEPDAATVRPATKAITTEPVRPHRPATPVTDTQRETVEENNAGAQSPRQESSEELTDRQLKLAIEAAYRGEPVAPAASGGPANPTSAQPDPRVAHSTLLMKAAGVASAEFVAHRDTWEWLANLAAAHSHFRIPSTVEELEGGSIEVAISGRSLIALLIKLWETRIEEGPTSAEFALAGLAYQRSAEGLAELTGEGRTVRIVLNDGVGG